MADQQRQMHIRIPVPLHRALRVRAAAEDKTIQDLVVEILSKQVAPLSPSDANNPENEDFNDK